MESSDVKETGDGPPDAKKMKSFDFNNESFPITVLDDINDIIDNPPVWLERILPLQKRSDNVYPNVINDCHVDIKNYRPQKRLDRRCIPKTLVCHDYKGGYLEDRFLSSTNVGNLYSFYHWNHIDIFVYFSHYLITIPPLCWLNTAHRNGCKILGTLITEFDQGEKICEKIFKDEDTMRIFATSLVQITKLFKFDGWLLNIENPMKNTDLLKRFVSYLTIKIHELNPDSLVIWYDSIIETGELKWQNELNQNNKYFFDNCDGIFLNYVWNLENIKRTCDYAKHRLNDVYVGIDVFGRNTYGGGNFNCYKAAQIIRRYHLSMALFAPGWTHETLLKQQSTVTDQEFFEYYMNRDCAFWNSLWPYLYTHPIQEFFRTSFFTGTNQMIYNVFAQHQQLSKIKHPKLLPNELITNDDYKNIPTLANKCNCLQCYYPIKGVRCLITKEFLSKTDCYVHRLFLCDLILNGQILLFYLINKPIKLTIKLLTINRNNTLRLINCLNYNKDDPINNTTKLEILPTQNQQLINYIKQNYEYLLNDDVNLSIYCYQFDVSECNLMEIGAIIDDDLENSCVLYAFGLEKDVII